MYYKHSMPPACLSYKILSYTFVGFLTVSYQFSALAWIFYNLYMTSVISTCSLSCFGCWRGLFEIYLRNTVFICGTYRNSVCAGEGKGRFQHMFWYCTFPHWRSVCIIVSKIIRQSLFWSVKLFILQCVCGPREVHSSTLKTGSRLLWRACNSVSADMAIYLTRLESRLMPLWGPYVL